MIFKKKYKRSAWFEGLLWAENMFLYQPPNDNLFVQHADGMNEYEIYWRNRPHEEPWIVKVVNLEFGAGILDYINYYNGKLK